MGLVKGNSDMYNQLSSEIADVMNTLVDYKTPEMFGAIGDLVTPDNTALNSYFDYCYQHGLVCDGNGKNYLIDGSTATIDEHFGVLVKGGMVIKNFNFYLIDEAPSLTTILTCKYDTKDYIFENCTFTMGVRGSNLLSREDGGNHALFFINEETFPTDWQTGFGNITIKNCKFIDTNSYGIFPTPFDGKLMVEDCDFVNQNAVGILTYATNSFVKKCKYSARTATTLVKALATDEIEKFTTPTAIRKNVTVRDSISSNYVFKVDHRVQYGVVYGDIIIENSHSDKILLCLYSGDYVIDCENVSVRNCRITDTGQTNSIELDKVKGNVFVDNFNIDKRLFAKIDGNLTIENCVVNSYIYLSNATIEKLKIRHTVFENIDEDMRGITTRYGTVIECGVAILEDIEIKTSNILFYNCNFRDIIFNNVYSENHALRLVINSAETPMPTNVIVNGLFMPTVATSAQTFITQVTGKVIVNGIGSTLVMGVVDNQVLNVTNFETLTEQHATERI